MKIWVDGDSCPQKVREIICRASSRVNIPLLFVANHAIPFTASNLTEMIVVAGGEGVADDYIVDNISEDDLCVTRDIPLAARLLEKKAVVLNDRGDQFLPETIRERLSIRDLMMEFRQIGLQPERHSSFGLKELQKFSATFDKILSKLVRSSKSL